MRCQKFGSAIVATVGLVLGLCAADTLGAPPVAVGPQVVPFVLCAADQTGPSIRISRPARPGPGGPDEMGPIEGVATGPNLKNLRVVIYTFTDKGYVQPYIAAPFTRIDADGKWGTFIHLGHTYAALLVGQGFRPPAAVHAVPCVGGGVLAVHVVAAASR